MITTIKVGVIGVSGYGTLQLVRLFEGHPGVELSYLGEDGSIGKWFADVYPYLGHGSTMKIESIAVNAIANRCEVVFLLLPDGQAQHMVPTLLAKGCKVLDLSADYRFFDLELYTHWYGRTRSDQTVARQAVYGLPEIYGDRIRATQLVGCPGSYPTASLLALNPLLKQGLINLDTIVIDAKSGTSEEGRREKASLLLAEVDGSIAAYSVARHRHTPEIEQVCHDLTGQELFVQFTPHWVPMIRGVLVTVYAKLRDPGLVREDLITIYTAFYRHSPWVKILPNGIYPPTKWVTGTNFCYIGIEVDPRTDRVIVMAAIDNLLKGQAGQAVQCLNLMMDWEETLGLPKLCFYP